MQIEKNLFDLSDFIKERYSSYILFVTGGSNYKNNNGHYSYVLLYKNNKFFNCKNFDYVKSPNVAIIKGTIDALKHINIHNKKLYIVDASQIGFKGALKGKGINYELIKEILKLCEEKNIEYEEVFIHGGGELLRNIIRNYINDR